MLLASEPIFQAVKLLGAAYLIYLGARLLWNAWRQTGPDQAAATGGASGLSAGRAFRQGLISNLGNPKMAVFFASILPQFGGAAQQ